MFSLGNGVLYDTNGQAQQESISATRTSMSIDSSATITGIYLYIPTCIIQITLLHTEIYHMIMLIACIIVHPIFSFRHGSFAEFNHPSSARRH